MKISVPFKSAAVLAVAAILVAGCSSSSAAAAPDATAAPDAASTSAPTSGQNQRPAGGTGQAGQNRQPGVSGTIAAVSGKTLQVQSASAQTAVSYTDATVFTTTTSATLADVVAGVCVAVIEFGGPTAAGTSTAPSTAAPGSTAAAAAGSRVTITDPTNGACTAQGFGGFGPNQPSGAAGASGAAAPTSGNGPSGASADGRGARNGQAVFGLVTAVGGSSITMTDSSGASQTATVTAASTYSKTTAGNSSELVVGQCARAVGPEDSSGAVAATSIVVSAPAQGGCNVGAGGQAGFGGQGGFGGNGRGNRPGGGAAASTTNG